MEGKRDLGKEVSLKTVAIMEIKMLKTQPKALAEEK